eukprot:Partr_v1_DN28616_c3_g1_i2_m49407 putative Conserved hypothetical protein
MNSISNIFAPRNRKVNFEVTIKIECLTDIPLVHGNFTARWKIRNALNDHRGQTQSIPIIDHTVTWNNEFTTKALMVIGKDSVLTPCDLSINIKKEANAGKKPESIGKVRLDLAEFAGTKFNSREYLLQQSKMNSTLRISVILRQMNGDPLYRIPEDRNQQDIKNQGLRNMLRGAADDEFSSQLLSFNLDKEGGFETSESEQAHRIVKDIFMKLEEEERELFQKQQQEQRQKSITSQAHRKSIVVPGA